MYAFKFLRQLCKVILLVELLLFRKYYTTEKQLESLKVELNV